jgi:hypothetical protein
MSLRILDTNWAFESSTTVTASTADPLFPVSNLKNNSRSNVWRSPIGAGQFILSTTLYIDFKESSGGSQLHASVAAGTYTAATLATAIVTAMQLAGTKLYTCSQSTSTGKWTIATSNGTYLALLIATGTNTANNLPSVIGFAVADLTGALTYTGANIAIHTEESVVFDFQTIVGVDTFAQFFHPSRGVKFTLNAVIHVQANATNIWSAPSVDVALTINESFGSAMNIWGTTQSYRYWRIKIIDPTNPELFVELSKLCFAKATVLSRSPANAFTVVDTDITKIQKNDYGTLYADVYPVLRSIQINWAAMSYADLTTLRGIYKSLGQYQPFAVSLIQFTGQTNAFTNEDLLVYGVFSKALQNKHKIQGYFDVPAEIMEVS